MGKVVVAGLYGMSALFQVRRFPKEGETVSAVGLEYYEPGGKGYNQAVAAKRAGVEVYFATAVGRDFHGEQAAGSMKRDELNGSDSFQMKGGRQRLPQSSLMKKGKMKLLSIREHVQP